MVNYLKRNIYRELYETFLDENETSLSESAEHLEWAFLQTVKNADDENAELQYQLAQLAFAMKLRSYT